jgi:hypothetical protein
MAALILACAGLVFAAQHLCLYEKSIGLKNDLYHEFTSFSEPFRYPSLDSAEREH